jgi:hypothetical protein
VNESRSTRDRLRSLAVVVIVAIVVLGLVLSTFQTPIV